MSTDTTQYGTIIFTKANYRAFKKKFVAFFNNRQDALYLSAISNYEKAKLLPKGTDLLNWADDLFLYTEKYAPLTHMTDSMRVAEDEKDRIINSFVLYNKNGLKLVKPKKSDFPKLKQSGDSEITCSHYGVISFRDEHSLFHWEVETGNNTVQEAGSSPVARFLFGELRKVTKWSKDTGGCIYSRTQKDGYYEDEEDDCGDYDDMGSPTIDRVYGPLGEKKKNEFFRSF